ncbi:MAG: hypothetical protein ACE5R6_13470 [Candidatus Heimdallarchaeota archaeon]
MSAEFRVLIVPNLEVGRNPGTDMRYTQIVKIIKYLFVLSSSNGLIYERFQKL